MFNRSKQYFVGIQTENIEVDQDESEIVSNEILYRIMIKRLSRVNLNMQRREV